MKKRFPRFYFSFRSPYSWLASRLLKDKYGLDHTRLEYIPSWEPDEITLQLLKERGGKVLYPSMSREKHLYILQDIKRMASHLGYSMTWPVDHQPWWELPNLAYLAARQQGRGREFFWSVYRARWEEGRDICSPEIIRALAKELDFDPDTIISAPENPALRQEGAEALLRCYRDGVFGVPFFILGYEKFWGVDRVDMFVAALNRSTPAAE